MFTGIVEEIGKVVKIEKRSVSFRFSIERPVAFSDIKLGDSLSINGVCLTVAKFDKKSLSFDVIKESLKKTSIGILKSGDKVNLERAIEAGGRFGGHFVTGHIDYSSEIKSMEREGISKKWEVALPKEYKRYIVPKGSVAVDGVSLTVAEVSNDSFIIYLIPHTLEKTTLGLKKKKDTINIEFDMLGKYVAQSKSESKASKVSMDFLKVHGFVE
ncbi:MAG: riboflavin synthase [Candidatus Omnitrophica bacterium CG07_land_8_20_14_0_80_42_15]|uniref:Riboflavin synthase n=1 Tax=Candidatus Aquitaenariimonas noxiae TaxID=1974741 RepID=A0A2J0KQC7_9BACT|nr:MAG: riboflavin synthase [Candidatus Omnitrophica bacterium CG07_land_8_20_14_0_80_42_15]